MNILVTSTVDPAGSAPNRLHHLLEHLRSKHSLTVIAAKEYWKPKRANVSRYFEGWKPLENIEIRYHGQQWAFKPIQEAAFTVWLKTFADAEKFDLHLNYNSLWRGVLMARKLLRFQIATVMDLADDLPAFIGYSERIPKYLRPAARGVADRLLQVAQRSSSLVTYSSPGLRRILTPGASEFVEIPNGVEGSAFSPSSLQHDRRYVKSYRPSNDDQLCLGFVGSLREWIDFGPVMSAMKLMIQGGTPTRLIVVGEEGQHPRVYSQAERIGVKNHVLCESVVPYVAVPSVMAQFDAGLIPFRQDRISASASPLKLLEYLAVGVPVVATPLGIREDLRSCIQEVRSTEDYFEAFRNIQLSSPDVKRKVKMGQRITSEVYSWSKIATQFEEALERVSNKT